jgi:integrase
LRPTGRTLHIAVQLSVSHAVGPTKGRKARSVPVPEFVLNELSQQCKDKAPGDLVFGGRDGGYLPRPKSSTGWFQAAVKKAKVQTISPRPSGGLGGKDENRHLPAHTPLEHWCGGGTRTLFSYQ